jgi:hypothetical protein
VKRTFWAALFVVVFSFLFGAVPGLSVSSGSAHASTGYKLLRFGGQAVKWGAPEMGAGASLTYALIKGEEIFSGVRNCPDTGGVEALLERAGISHAELEAEVAGVFAHWEEIANVRFRQVEDVSAADILIGAQLRPRGLGYADITEDIIREGSVGTITKGMVCLNPELRWTLASQIDAANEEGAAEQILFDLEYTLTHEIGHLLGLDHPGAHGTLMSFSYDADVRALQAGDIAGAVALYGPARRGAAPIASASLPAVLNADSDILRLNTRAELGGEEDSVVSDSVGDISAGEAGAVLRPAVRLLAAPEESAAELGDVAENTADEATSLRGVQPGL